MAGKREIVAADIGGTNARFAIATIGPDGAIGLGEPVILATAGHAGLLEAWRAFASVLNRPPPSAASIAIAAPIDGDRVSMSNSPWRFSQAEFASAAGLDALMVLNDFAAVGHAVAKLDHRWFTPLCGPAGPLLPRGVTSVVGPGTGTGVALLHRQAGKSTVIATEGAHAEFAPVDAVDDAILARLRQRFGRVSTERVLSGAGLADIHATLGDLEAREVAERDELSLWRAAMTGADRLAGAALDRFCMALGSFAGDVALMHGAGSVVIAGGTGLRLAEKLPSSGFADRFVAKGRYRERMAGLPVRILTYPDPGLLGAAAAFA